jgi:hypothetical protein
MNPKPDDLFIFSFVTIGSCEKLLTLPF